MGQTNLRNEAAYDIERIVLIVNATIHDRLKNIDTYKI